MGLDGEFIETEEASMIKMKELLIFDFDGVLEDTFDWNFKVASECYEDLDKEDYRTWFDGNIYEHPVIKAAGSRNVTEFFEKYKTGFADRVMQNELKNMLVALRTKYRLVIITSIDDNIVEEYLGRSGISNLFGEVWGVQRQTSKVEKFNDLLSLYSVTKDKCLFVTDTLGDIKEANKVGIDSVGVTWGYQDCVRLKRGNPIKIVDTPRELLDYLIN